MCVFFLEPKSEAFSFFLQFKAFIDRQSNYQIKTLRTDHGGEFISRPFMNYCKENGIERQLIIRYTPEQNKVTEHKNCKIMEMARSMIKDKGLLNNFWVEVINKAVYILNRSPTKQC